MYNNSLIYMITPAAASVVADGVVPLTTIARRRGKYIASEADSIVLKCPGYYAINISVTFTAPVAGVVELQVRNNGVAIPGLTASTTITTATTEVDTLNISGIVRVPCCGDAIVLTLVNAGVEITTSNISFDVEYLD